MDPSAAPATLDLFVLLEPYIREAITLLVTSVIGAALLLLKQYTGIQVRAEHRDAITAAINRKAQAVLREHGPELRRSLAIDVDNPAVAEVTEYIQAQLPKRLKAMGMSAENVRNMAAAEIAKALGVEDLPPPPELTEEEIKKRMIELLEQLATIRKENIQ